MPHLRTMVEQGLRKAGVFEATKLGLRRAQTRCWAGASVVRRMAGGGALPKVRRGGVVLFHSSRSGSTVLGGQLGAHPEIYWDGEIFNYHWRRWKQRPGDRRAEAYREIRRRMSHPPTAYFGFEINPIQIHYGGLSLDAFIPAMKQRGITHFIQLRRENVLRLLVSERVAAQRGMYHLKPGETGKAVKIALGPEKMASHLGPVTLAEKIGQFQDRYAQIVELVGDAPLLDMSYEQDVMADPKVAYRRVCEFLGVSEVPSRVGLRPTTNKPLSDLIEDYDAVRAMLEPTANAWMLDGPTAAR